MGLRNFVAIVVVLNSSIERVGFPYSFRNIGERLARGKILTVCNCNTQLVRRAVVLFRFGNCAILVVEILCIIG